MKKAICLLFAVLMVLSLAGCNPTKTITSQELSMKVPEDMTDASKDPELIDAGYTGFSFAQQNEKLFIGGTRTAISAVSNGMAMTPKDYANQMYQEKGLAAHGATYAERQSRDYVYFRFQMTLVDGEHEYICAFFKSSQAFWLIEMDSLAIDFDEAAYLEYLDTVTFQ